MIGLPNTGFVSFTWALAFREMIVPNPCFFYRDNTPRIDIARNNAVEAMFRRNCEALLFWDTDVVPYLPEETRRQRFLVVDRYAIMKLMNRGLDIVGGLYMELETDAPQRPTAWVFVEGHGLQPIRNRSGLVRVDCISTGFLLIRRRVFEKLREVDPNLPFFWYSKGETPPKPHPWDQYAAPEDRNKGIGEDFWFSWRARNAGFDIYCDCDLKVAHIGLGAATEEGVTIGNV